MEATLNEIFVCLIRRKWTAASGLAWLIMARLDESAVAPQVQTMGYELDTSYIQGEGQRKASTYAAKE